jgi:hypothetical protein
MSGANAERRIIESAHTLYDVSQQDTVMLVDRTDSQIRGIFNEIDQAETADQPSQNDAGSRAGEANPFANLLPSEISAAVEHVEEAPEQIYDHISQGEFDMISGELDEMKLLPNSDAEKEKLIQDYPILEKIFEIAEIDDPGKLDLAERHFAADTLSKTNFGDLKSTDFQTEYAGNIYRIVDQVRKLVRQTKAV